MKPILQPRHSAGALLLCAGAALAQTTPSAPPVPAKDAKPAAPVTGSEPVQAAPMSSVTVSAERPTNRIDRQVYDVKQDAASSSSSAAEALQNVPSVTVDPDGSVALRGNRNVQILVDGKPSAMLQGENRGPALQSIPSDDIESVEVINNPGAQFGNEGGGGPILNLVMRRERRAGGFGVVNANAGPDGRYNSSLNGSYNEGRHGVQGGMFLRRDGLDSVGETRRERIHPVTGAITRSTVDSSGKGMNESAGMFGAYRYNLGDKDTLNANLNLAFRTNDGSDWNRYRTLGEDGSTVEDYLRSSQREGSSRNYAVGGRWDHKGELQGENLKVDLRISGSETTGDYGYRNSYTVNPRGLPDARSGQDTRNGNRIADFTGDYERPDEQGILKLGYKVASNRNTLDYRYFDINPATQAEVVNAMRTNLFQLKESVYALYGSYQMRLNERWGMQGGLRAEYTDADIRQFTTQIFAKNSYFNVIPSFFATYKATEDANIRFAYAHRIRRPGAGDLNPFVRYGDEFNVSSGNPQLKPAETDSFELGYETKFGAVNTNLRGYYRKESDSILERKVFISETVLLTTRDNVGSNRSGGLEFTLSGKVTPTLTLNTSGNLAFIEQNVAVAGQPDAKHTATALTGQFRLNWQATPADMLQTAIQAQGKTLLGQGYRQPSNMVSATWRHSFTPRLATVLNVSDVFSTREIEVITNTAMLREHSLRRFDGRVAYLGLSYRFGGPDGMMVRQGGPGMGPPPGAMPMGR
ncbi:outer membrane beta-barrel family protein [Massilia endophytica]|uniref:outer membrane beta-barrel family protein n=1 Tax=Massilia endophytica TaxID=2899220 RepID=UPI001E4348D6|nr:outer membrane beta-barrel family protein [Massilia endophytica]UGQ47386.1 TonB-dependent receptor [Massilia endophytica]